ncbi:MAG: hypothetical protein ABSE27_13240 [Acidobacteriaceae bacterium]|jgi:hypothetical protein
MLDTAGKAEVVFDGEFYGPGVPDPKLPEAIKKSYQPGWGHLGAFRTKLVVHAIQSVEPVPAEHPASADLGHEVPLLQEAALPVYPPIGRAASVTGKVIVELTVSDGKVTGTDVKSGARMLVGGTVANLQTWRFASDVSGKFTVTYTYAISGEATDSPMNPTVEMLPSLDVNITARPIKPIVMYGAQSVPATDTLLHESGHVDPPKPQ